MAPILTRVGQSFGFGASSGAAGLTLKAPYDWAFSFNGGSATLGMLSASAQSTLTVAQGNPLDSWVSNTGIDNSGQYSSSIGNSDQNLWAFPSSNSVAGNVINGNVGNFDQYAISCWVKTTLTGDGGSYAVYETVLGDTSGGVWGGFGVNNGKCCMTQSGTDHETTAAVNSGVWTHMGMIIEPTSLRLFVNGQLDYTNNSMTWSNNMAFKNFCGTYNYGKKKIANLDAVVIWIDRMITPADITTAYEIGNFTD